MLREWLLFVSAAGLAATSIYVRGFPAFSLSDIQVLCLLWVLFVAAKGLEHSGLILQFSRSIETGQFIPLKLVAATFILSVIVTNDIALIVIVPLTLAINTEKKDILVILEALAANAGAALTPFGNPQNLFIYWRYHIPPADFISSIAPFSLFFLAILLIASIAVRTANDVKAQYENILISHTAYVYGVLLVIVVLTVLRVLPITASAIVPIYALVFDRKALRVDYGLLFTFLCFIGLAENIRGLLTSSLEHPRHIFMLSALLSQVMSNVPAALLLAKFTTQWKALLWGTNVGGFGNLISSFANMITYKLYIRHAGRSELAPFTIKFVGMGYAMFFLGIILYMII